MTPEIHHRDPVGDVLHHGEIMRDKDVGKAKPVLQVAQQIEDLRTDRYVQRGYRLVADDQFRFDRQRARNGDALALAAGKFVRVAAREARLQPDQMQQFGDPFATARARHEIVQRQRFAQDPADGHARVERGVGVLEDDLGIPAEAAQLAGIQGQQIAALEADTAGIRLDQPEHQPAHGRFSASGFADQRQRLAGVEAKADPVDRPDQGGRPSEQRTIGDEIFCQSFDLEQGGHDTSLSSGALMQRDQ